MTTVRLLLIATTCFVTTFATFGQSATTLSGNVVSTQQQPVPFATVMLRNVVDGRLARPGMAKTALTDTAGRYVVSNVVAGRYVVAVTAVGFRPAQSDTLNVAATDVAATSVAATLPPIVLAEATAALAEVTVRAQKPLVEMRPDKLVLNVQGSLTAAGSTALELLQRAPGVLLDPNDNLILQGKNGVRVYIDGKPSPLGPADLAVYLRTLQATDVEAIEIITQPSARFDAAGNAGIINIRLKRSVGSNAGNTSGSATLGLAQGRYFPKLNGSATVNHRTGRVGLFANYSHRTARDWSFIRLYREQAGANGQPQFFDQRSKTQSGSVSHNARAGADWALSRRSTLGVLLDGTLRSANGITAGRTPIGLLGGPAAGEPAAGGPVPTTLLLAENRNAGRRLNGNVNLNYRYAETSDRDTLSRNGGPRELSVDADYGHFWATSRAFQPNRYVDPVTQALQSARDYRMTTATAITLRTLKADYSQRLAGGKLSAGFKLSSVRTDNDFGFFDVVDGLNRVNPDRSNRFVYTENVNAAYAQYEKSRGKWQAQAGLRIEQTASLGELTGQAQDSRVDRRYVNAFPSAGLTWNATKTSTFATQFSRRIDRPSYQALNPFESKLDELTYQKGNAFLRPQYTNTLRLSHTYKYTLTTSLSYSDTQDFFTEITDVLNHDTTETGGQPRNYITTRNLARQRVVSLEVSYPFSIAKWWSVFLNVNAYRTVNRANFGAGRQIGLAANVVSLFAQHTLTLPRQWSLEVSAFYTSPSIWGGTFRNQRFWGSTIGLQRKIWAERGNRSAAGSPGGTVVVTVTDPFNSQQWRGISRFGGLYMDARGGWESQQVRASFTYTFGNKQLKATRRRSTGLEDESKRL